MQKKGQFSLPFRISYFASSFIFHFITHALDVCLFIFNSEYSKWNCIVYLSSWLVCSFIGYIQRCRYLTAPSLFDLYFVQQHFCKLITITINVDLSDYYRGRSRTLSANSRCQTTSFMGPRRSAPSWTSPLEASRNACRSVLHLIAFL